MIDVENEYMQYDFDEIVPRRGTNSYKWDNAPEGVLPLWVADMDFKTAKPVTDALQKRVAHGIFGYTKVPQEYYDAVIGWFGRRHGLHIEKDWIIYTSGVVPAVSAILKAMTVPGDKVLLLTPVYNCFYSSIRNNGCEAVSCPLVRTGDTYAIDFDENEAGIRCIAAPIRDYTGNVSGALSISVPQQHGPYHHIESLSVPLLHTCDLISSRLGFYMA